LFNLAINTKNPPQITPPQSCTTHPALYPNSC
jgi:hypothetical protein